MKVVVHGATGAQGSPVVSVLGEAGHEVVGLSRHDGPSAGGVTMTNADLSDESSLAEAYQSADAVFLHLPIPVEPDAPARWARAAISAVAAARVDRIVLSTSGASLDDTGPGPLLEARHQGMRHLYEGLVATAGSVVALTPRLFLENLLLPFVATPLTEQGVLAYPLPADKPISWVSHQDVAQAVLVAVDSATPAGAYDVGPTQPITGPVLADAVGRGLGRSVVYEAITPEEFARRAEPIFGPDAAQGIGQLYAEFASDPNLALPDNSQRLATDRMLSVEDWAEHAFTREDA